MFEIAKRWMLGAALVAALAAAGCASDDAPGDRPGSPNRATEDFVEDECPHCEAPGEAPFEEEVSE